MAKTVGILGSGTVGKTLSIGFHKLGYNVMIGTGHKEKLSGWLTKEGKGIKAGSFHEAAKFGELLVLCCKGDAFKDVINLAGKDNFKGKIVIDVTNPLIFEGENKPPKLYIGFPSSQGMEIQKILSDSKVVKAFNIVTASYMCSAKLKEGVPDMFVAGDDPDAKKTVSKIAAAWGWPVSDLGGIDQSYLMEALAMVWMRYGFLNNHWTHAFKLLKS